MGYLTIKDYKKIKGLIETFLDSPIVIDNLFKALVLFLETKNKMPEPLEIKETKVVNTEAQTRVEQQIRLADEASLKFVNKLLKKNDSKRKSSRISQ